MKRLLQVLSLGAAVLVFTATAPGIAVADNGGKHYGGYQKPYKPYYKPYKGHKNYGHYRREQNRHWDNNRPYRDDRQFRRDKHRRYGHNRRRHRNEYYGRRHSHRGHRHDHNYGTYFGLHLYPQIVYPDRSAAVPPAYPVRPQETYLQPAVVDQQPQESQAPSTCLMTREYQTEIVVGVEVVPAYGKACLQPDGSWYRGPAVPDSY